MDWVPFDGGATLGGRGSEGGCVLRDEEHPHGARITLERGGPTAPYAITCGVYGAMLHTAWAGNEAEGVAKYEAMRERLVPLLQSPAGEERYAALSRFADDF